MPATVSRCASVRCLASCDPAPDSAPSLEPQLAQLSRHRCVKVPMHCIGQKPRRDCYGQLLPENSFGNRRYEEPDQEVRNRPCQQAWRSYGFSHLIHDHRFHHQRWPAATAGTPLPTRRTSQHVRTCWRSKATRWILRDGQDTLTVPGTQMAVVTDLQAWPNRSRRRTFLTQR
jgi:hypothetical protein